MVELQFLNKLLTTKDTSILFDNGIDIEYFPEYIEEFTFIKDHIENYGKTPDLETFVSKFTTFEVLDVTESDRYLVDTLREEYLYSKTVPVIKQAAELLKGDANEASRYLQSELVNLTPNYSTPATNITKSKNRYDIFVDKANNKDKWFISSGFEELDDIIGGWQCGEEYVVVFARTGIGKSWVVVKFAEHAWSIGKNVGYISPEMSPDKIGYRFDTLHNHFSNRALVRGDTYSVNSEEYEKYLDELSTHSNNLFVSTPRDFNNKITVTKLRNFVKANKLEVLVIDGITYMSDERYKRGDNKTTSLTNISEDLMQLSCELKIPVITVVQSNRGGVEKETPDLEDIRDSDGISHNATKIISLNQKDAGLIMTIKKNRDGMNNGKLTYIWDIDTGKFEWLPSQDDTASDEMKEERKEQIKHTHKEEARVVF